jgi:hypothetical protein
MLSRVYELYEGVSDGRDDGPSLRRLLPAVRESNPINHPP